MQRRRAELHLKLDALEELSDDASSAKDLEVRTKELKALNGSIEVLREKIQGELSFLQCDLLHRSLI